MTMIALMTRMTIAQTTVVDVNTYSSMKNVYNLSKRENLTYLRIDYIPQGGPASMSQVVNASFTDVRPSNFTAVNTGYIAAGSSSVRETVYLLYSLDNDTITFASTGRQTMIKNSLANFGLGSIRERQKAFNLVKNPDIVNPVDLTIDRLVDEDPLQYGALTKLVIFVAIALGAGLSLYIAYKWMVRLIG